MKGEDAVVEVQQMLRSDMKAELVPSRRKWQCLRRRVGEGGRVRGRRDVVASSNNPISRHHPPRKENHVHSHVDFHHEHGDRRFEQEFRDFYERKKVECALAALDFYNEMRGVQYQLVEAIDSNCICASRGPWFHCNFTARPKLVVDEVDDATPQRFFAELLVQQHGLVLVNSCHVLDDFDTNAGGCKDCSPAFGHPRRGFEAILDVKLAGLKLDHPGGEFQACKGAVVLLGKF